MATATTLSINGYRDEPVPNRFLRPRGAIDRLAILLPGLGYTLDMPLFYYAENLLLEQGWDVLRVAYAYNQRTDFQDSSEVERARWLLADATAAYRAGLSQRTYDRVALVGKSLGTLAMGHLLTMEQTPIPACAVWLTPLLGRDVLREQIRRYGGPSLFAIGTADSHYDARALESVLAATNGEAIVVEGAEHGMDIEGNPLASVHAVAQVVEGLVRFFR